MTQSIPRQLQLGPDWHRCIVTKVADGDTIRIDATLGLGVELRHEPVRLLAIQAPELKGPEKWQAQEARRALSGMVLSRWCLLHCPDNDRDRYGRWLGYLWRPSAGDLLCINTWLVANGHARQWAPKRHRHGHYLPPEIVPTPTINPAGDRSR